MEDYSEEKTDNRGRKCESCEKRKLSVHERLNEYANDVHNDRNATHIVCDECDYQNRMDI